MTDRDILYTRSRGVGTILTLRGEHFMTV